MPKYYKARNIAKVGANYIATGGVVAGSFLLGNPIAMAISAAVSGAIVVGATKVLKKSASKEFVKHPDVHPDAPNLGKTARELYAASGLKAPEGYPIYSFQPVPQPAKKKKSIMARISKPMDPNVLNASALRIGDTTVISISDPLLKLLDDKEEKAVLAHEFTHAAARHTGLKLPIMFADTSAAINNAITQTIALLALGWQALLISSAAQMGGELLFKVVTGKGRLLAAKDENLTLPELARKKKFKKWSKIAGLAVFMGAAAYFSPVCLGILAATKGLTTAATLLSKSLSRSGEYQADAGAVTLGGDPLSLMTALRKMTIVRKNCLNEALEMEKAAKRSDGTLPKAGVLTRTWNKLNSTHPTVDNRIKRLSKIARKQGVPEEQIQAAAKGDLIVPKMTMTKKTLQAMV